MTLSHRLCIVHNLVNLRLHKPEFDCANLDAEYDCGCGDEPLALNTTTTSSDAPITGPALVKGGR
jgi:FAD-linked sulfhydryl oxidase